MERLLEQLDSRNRVIPYNLILTTPVLIFLLSTPFSVHAADWNATGGSIPDAPWSGDTPALTGQNNVGELDGEGGVSGGSATYQIPIKVVPGRAGMQPNVALNYSSSGGNGIAGMGWGLSTGGNISRCGKTLAQDGVTDKVHFDKSKDRLCLNGQKLVSVSGVYGNSGAQYRTEVDAFVKVVQTGDMDGSSTWFTVTRKNGTKDFFGQNSNSRHSPAGVSKTAVWMQNRSQDVSGNKLVYWYTSHGKGEYTLATIRYTGKGSDAGDRRVTFQYENRPDVSHGYQSGGLRAMTKRLKSITTLYQSTQVRKYKLTYKVSDTSDNSLLTGATECGFDNGVERCFPPTTFDWYEGAPTFKFERLHYVMANGQKSYIGPTARVASVLPKKDMNGDGTLDWPDVFVNADGKFQATNNFEDLGACQLIKYTGQSRCFNADFNQDGLTDSWKLVGGTTKTLQIGYSKYDGSPPSMTSTSISLNTNSAGGEEILGITDLNGDGRSDILVRRGIVGSGTGTSKVEVILHSGDDNAPYGNSGPVVYSIPARNIPNAGWSLDEDVQVLGDFDGNGIEDVFVFVRAATAVNPSNHNPQWHKPKFRKVLFSQPSATYAKTTSQYGDGTRPTNYGPLPNYADHEMLVDMNGDGLLDVLGISNFGVGFRYKINLGNGQLSGWMFLQNGNTMFSKLKKGFVPLEPTPPAGGGGSGEDYHEPRLATAYVLDQDSNGRPNLLIPYNRVVSFCYDHSVIVTTSGVWGTQTFCDDEMYRIGEDVSKRQPVLADSNDRSIWEYYRADFVVTGYSNNIPQLSVSLVPTDIVGTISEGATVDLYGNGHSDFATMVSCFTTGTNCSYGDASGNNDLTDYQDSGGANLTPGAYMNRNVGSYGPASSNTMEYAVVDRLESATTAMNNNVEWDYSPLNSGMGASDFYTVNQAHLGSTDGYLHFSANVSVVSELRVSDGIGGLNSYGYKYRDATLNTGGRGFQGFKQIVVDDHANNVRSVSDYHIKFPLTGSLIEVRRCLISPTNLNCTSQNIDKTEYTWDLWRDGSLKLNVVDESTNYSNHVFDNSAAQNRYWVSPRLETATHYKTSSSHSAGNNNLQPISVFGNWTHRTESESQFNTNGCSTLSRSTYKEPAGANKAESRTNTYYLGANTSSWWLCKINYQETTSNAIVSRAAEYAQIEAGTDVQKKVKTAYTWNNTHRKPATTVLSATQGGGKPTKTTFTYNSHGLPTLVRIEATRYDAPDFAMTDRDTTTTYTTDGYFVRTVTNAKGHVTTTVTDEKFGVPIQVIDPNGQQTSFTYDHFGRLESSRAPGEPSVRIAYSWCNGNQGSSVWCLNDPDAIYRVMTRAAGTPDKNQYFDRFNREVGSYARNFADTSWYRIRSQYNNRGQLRWETNSHNNLQIGGTQKFTYYDGYDNLGRLTRVRKPQANDTYLNTSYSYNGHVVDIAAQSNGVGAQLLDMSRKINGLGQLVWTQDAYGNLTSYAYDGSGNPISLEDADGNTITTKFNALGQKLHVDDPNAGRKTFKHNSLGELQWEKDANGDVVRHEYDVLGRVFDRFTNGVVSGRWRYDGTGATGRKGMIDYEENSASNVDKLVKYYRYATTSGGKDYLAETRHFVYELGGIVNANKYYMYYYMDNNFGRPTGMRYGPTNLRVVYEYNSAGYMSRIKNASSGYVYREITELDALGNVASSLIGNGILTQDQEFHPATGQMTDNHVTKTAGSSTVHRLEYDYEGFGNLYQSIVTAKNNIQNYETFTYDKLHRLKVSDRAYSYPATPNDTVAYDYSATGNIELKDDYFSSALYGNEARNQGGNAGPNAIRRITKVGGGTFNFTYDDNGNMLTGDGRIMTYTEFNKPKTIAKNGVTSTFSYGANLTRYRQVKNGLAGGPQSNYYVEKLFEREVQGNRTTFRHYLDDVAVVHREVVGATTTWTMAFNLKDRLGGTVTLADENGDVLEHRSYDPFGKPRRGDFVDASGTIQSAIANDPHAAYQSDPLTDRGFTSHEHLDEQAIIHMNGRVYDYNIARFTSVDPFVQNPTSTQSINPYSYIMNNPLSGTDPSGYTRETEVTEASYKYKQTGSNLTRSGSKKGITTITDLNDPADGNGGGTPGSGYAPRATSVGGGAIGDISTMTASTTGGTYQQPVTTTVGGNSNETRTSQTDVTGGSRSDDALENSVVNRGPSTEEADGLEREPQQCSVEPSCIALIREGKFYHNEREDWLKRTVVEIEGTYNCRTCDGEWEPVQGTRTVKFWFDTMSTLALEGVEYEREHHAVHGWSAPFPVPYSFDPLKSDVPELVEWARREFGIRQ